MNAIGPHLCQKSDHRGGTPAFTLIEIVVALTIIAVIAAVAIPTMNGLNREEKAAEPLRALSGMVQEVRQRAMHERRAYQIVFEREAIHACEFTFPDLRREEFLKHLAELRAPPKDDAVEREQTVRTKVDRVEMASPLSLSAANGRALPNQRSGPPEPPPERRPWTQTISLEPKTECAVLLWGDGEWDLIEGEKIRRWVFQPTGMANPARVRLRLGPAEFETAFDALIGEVRRERSQPRTNSP